jgi:hypothetical protein
MQRRFAEEQYRERSREYEKGPIDQRRYRDILDEEEEGSEEEEVEVERTQNSGPANEDVVEVIAPLLKEKPKPLTSFDDDCIPEVVKSVVKTMGFKEPTIIQKYCMIQLFSDPHRLVRM